MGLQGYVGSGEDQRRIRRQEKEREEKKKLYEKAKEQSDANVEGAGLRQFGAGTSETLDAAFKIETVGLVTREEFLSKRDTLRDRMDEAKAQAKREADKALDQEKAERSKKRAKIAAKTKLSFAQDDDEDGDGEEEEEAAGNGLENGGSKGQEPKQAAAQAAASRKLGKDPTAATDFLPDREREAQEIAVREQLKKEYELRQRLVRNEPLKITYSYWDGQGHRRVVTIRKGDSIAQFLQKVKEQLHPDFRELRAASVSSLMYVKEDLIIPQQTTFYDLISSKARGKSGPLFHFDVHEDIRMQNDATVEKDESHAGKVVDRHWYNRNKHIFPASRWEVYDPETNYETYTIHGNEVK